MHTSAKLISDAWRICCGGAVGRNLDISGAAVRTDRQLRKTVSGKISWNSANAVKCALESVLMKPGRDTACVDPW